MTKRLALVAAAATLLFSPLAAWAAPSTDLAQMPAGHYEIDKTHASITGTSRPDLCRPTRDSRPTVMHRIAISAAPDTGDMPAAMASGARKAMTIEATIAYRR